MSKTIIKITNVSKDYYIYKSNLRRVLGILFKGKHSDVRHALKNVTFTVEQGERVAVFGVVESGCSTLLRILGGITHPSKGSVKVKGDVNAFLNAKPGMYDDLSCVDNIYLKGLAVGVNRKRIEEQEEQILSFVNAGKYANLPLRRAPKGIVVKIALALHMMKPADVFLLDYCLNKGGLENRKICEGALESWIRKNPDMTVVIATRRTVFAEGICERGIILNKGEIVFDGPIDEAAVLFREKYRKKTDKSEMKEGMGESGADSDDEEEDDEAE